MSARFSLVAVCVLGACGQPLIDVQNQNDLTHGDTDGGHQSSGCMSDTDCGSAEVCVDCQGVGLCTPGCRDDSQCKAANNICQLGTVCQACPCPPGWCVIDPCRDLDGDGYAATTDPSIVCPGKQIGDCDDSNAAVHPNAPEQCTNYIDDNCDGVTDEHDPACTCPDAEARCENSWECGTPGVNACTKGCCTLCAERDVPSCDFGGSFQYCPNPYGIDPSSGCSYGYTCDECSGCDATIALVCAQNGSTYDNLCRLQQRHGGMLHDGACVPGEGIQCEGDGGCDAAGALYCRDACGGSSSCSNSTCTKKGVCVADSDCPAGLSAPAPAACDAGTATLACINQACVSVCK